MGAACVLVGAALIGYPALVITVGLLLLAVGVDAIPSDDAP
jgi:hypothetical protein